MVATVTVSCVSSISRRPVVGVPMAVMRMRPRSLESPWGSLLGVLLEEVLPTLGERATRAARLFRHGAAPQAPLRHARAQTHGKQITCDPMPVKAAATRSNSFGDPIPMGMEKHAGSFVMPGDAVMQVPGEGSMSLGSGLQQCKDVIKVTKAGVLKHQAPRRFWIETRHQRYVPAVDDLVVGTILQTQSDNYTVNIGGPAPAQLPVLEFTGATRRNKPMLKVGDPVYARVTLAHRDIDPMVSCVDESAKSKGLGPLKGGYVFTCSTGTARSLLCAPPCVLLTELGKHCAYDLAVGVNGTIWVSSQSPRDAIAVKMAIEHWDRDGQLDDRGVRSLVKELCQE
mmetsp:Transcript_13438/g.33736  ORF Transcript_13438/g.33736 Transcript_13438/m.33736 type:complete len:341 (-) Transcript_13438:508-1530(-)